MGAATGMVGILYVLMKALKVAKWLEIDEELNTVINTSVK